MRKIEAIYIVALFVAPGMVVKELRDYFVKEKGIKNDVLYSYLFNVVLDSFIIGIATITAMNAWLYLKIYTLYGLLDILASLKWLTIYLCIALLFAVIWCIIKNTLILKIMLWVKNKILGKATYTNHSTHATVWDGLIADKEINGSWQVVSIYKNEKYITSGMIDSYSNTDMDQFALKLEHKEKVEELKVRHPELFHVYYEYYNTTTDFRVLFYDQEPIETNWKKYFPF